MTGGSRRSRARIAATVTVSAIALAAVVVWREPIWSAFTDRALIQERVAAAGVWGPLVSIGLNALQVVLAPMPGYLIGLANGYLYGVWLGTLYSLLGLLIGSAAAMALSRYLGRPLVERLVKPEQLDRWDRIASRRGPVFFFLVFLVPGLPDDIVAFVVGLSQLPIPQMVILAMLGRLPGVFVSSWIGARAADLPLWAWVPLVAGVGGLAWAFLRYGDHVERLALHAIRMVSPQRECRESAQACATGQDDPQAPR